MSGPVVEHEHINRKSVVNNGVVSVTYCEECDQWWVNVDGSMEPMLRLPKEALIELER